MDEIPCENQSTLVQRMYVDMYLGRGKYDPPFTTRLDRVEQVLVSLRYWKWIIIGATITMIANIIDGFIRKGF